MKTFYKVVTRVTDKRVTIKFADEVQAEHKPENTCVESFRADIYEDYFITKEEADLFIRTQRRTL